MIEIDYILSKCISLLAGGDKDLDAILHALSSENKAIVLGLYVDLYEPVGKDIVDFSTVYDFLNKKDYFILLDYLRDKIGAGKELIVLRAYIWSCLGFQDVSEAFIKQLLK